MCVLDKEPTNGELMVELHCIKKTLTNHLRHHERYETALFIGIMLVFIKQLLFG
jgi:hypothetical protein